MGRALETQFGLIGSTENRNEILSLLAFNAD
jgi:hypothetical protein